MNKRTTENNYIQLDTLTATAADTNSNTTRCHVEDATLLGSCSSHARFLA